MLVMRRDEVNLKILLNRFDEVNSKYHEVELEATDKDDTKIYFEDWAEINNKILEDYQKKEDYDLVIAEASRADTVFRKAKCFSYAYKLKDFRKMEK